jgi:hypothetical protein
MPRKRTCKTANSQSAFGKEDSFPKRDVLLSNYGQCPVCEAPILYPGLDGFKCRDCGWLKVTEIALILKKRATALAKYTKQNPPKAVDANPSSLFNNPAIIAITSRLSGIPQEYNVKIHMSRVLSGKGLARMQLPTQKPTPRNATYVNSS